MVPGIPIRVLPSVRRLYRQGVFAYQGHWHSHFAEGPIQEHGTLAGKRS
jgi:hypothetical protein